MHIYINSIKYDKNLVQRKSNICTVVLFRFEKCKALLQLAGHT